jgi:hypothetical protein
MRDPRKRPIVQEEERPRAAAGEPPVKLTKEDIRKLVEVFLILDRWKREDDKKAAAEQASHPSR